MKTYLLFIIYAFLITQTGFSQSAPDEEIELSSQLSNSEIAFESTTDLVIRVQWRGQRNRYMFEAFPLPETKNLQVQGTSSSISSGSDEEGRYVTREYIYTLKPTQGGTGAIEPITLRYVSFPDSIPGQLTTQRFQVLIEEPRVVESSGGEIPGWLFIVGGFGLIAIVAVIILFARKKTAKPDEEQTVSPEAQFIDKLAVIRKEFGTDRKHFFSRLYKLLTRYFERKYGVAVTGRTTQAIAEELGEKDIEIEHKVKLVGWLNLADKEKYAPMAGEPGDIIRLTTEMTEHFRKIRNEE